MPWYQNLNTHFIFHIKVKTNKKVTQIAKIEEDFILIDVHAQPIEGKANEELIDFISNEFELKKRM